MNNRIDDTCLYILYVTWIIFFILGIRYILKYKLWKPVNYLRITIILFIYIIILYQIRIQNICFHNVIEKYQNANQTFRLYDRNQLQIQIEGGGAPTKFVWEGPLNWPNGDGVTNYANDTKGDHNNGKHCDNTIVRELTELTSVTLQQLSDARAAYNRLIEIKNHINTINLNDNDALSKMISEIKLASESLKKRS